MRLGSLAAVLWTAILAGGATSAAASDAAVVTDARACAAITAPDARLECFDLMVGKHGLAVPAAAARGDAPGRWETSETRSPVDDSRSLTVVVRATSVSGGGMAFGEPTAELAFRCRERKLDILLLSNVIFGSGGDQAVLVRVGQQTARQERWSPSDTGRALGIWGGARATAFARELAGTEATSLVIRADTFRSQITAQLDITGARQALEPVLNLCAAPARAPAPNQQRR